MEAEKKPFIVKLGDAEVDLADLPPLTLGDKRALKGLGVDFVKFVRAFGFAMTGAADKSPTDPDEEAKIVLFALRKRRAETTEAEVDALPAMISMRIVQHIIQRAAEVDDPFSTRSTSSARSTGGESAKSAAEPTPSSPPSDGG